MASSQFIHQSQLWLSDWLQYHCLYHSRQWCRVNSCLYSKLLAYELHCWGVNKQWIHHFSVELSHTYILLGYYYVHCCFLNNWNNDSIIHIYNGVIISGKQIEILVFCVLTRQKQLLLCSREWNWWQPYWLYLYPVMSSFIEPYVRSWAKESHKMADSWFTNMIREVCAVCKSIRDNIWKVCMMWRSALSWTETALKH